MSDFNGIWLAVPILELQDLNLTEKVILSQVIALSRDGECNAKNDYLASKAGITVTTTSTTLSKLREKQYLHIEDNQDQGNKRQMYPSLKTLNTLFKNLKEGDSASLKIFKTLYKNFKEGITKPETPYLKILNTLFKNFKELIYRIDNKDYSKEDSKKYNLSLRSDKGAKAPFWSILIIPFQDYKKWLTEWKTICVEAEKKQKPPLPTPPQFPDSWTPTMIDLYLQKWLPFRQKSIKKKLLPESIQEQIDSLSGLTEEQLRACILNSTSNGYQGLFPDKFKNGHANNRQLTQNPINGNAFGQGAIIPSGATYRQQTIRRNPAASLNGTGRSDT